MWLSIHLVFFCLLSHTVCNKIMGNQYSALIGKEDDISCSAQNVALMRRMETIFAIIAALPYRVSEELFIRHHRRCRALSRGRRGEVAQVSRRILIKTRSRSSNSRLKS